MTSFGLQLHLKFKGSLTEFIKKNLAEGAHHKSYEGRMELSFTFPSYFDDPDLVEEPYVNIHLSCYLLIPFPLCECDWNASSFEMALYKAEKDIYKLLDQNTKVEE